MNAVFGFLGSVWGTVKLLGQEIASAGAGAGSGDGDEDDDVGAGYTADDSSPRHPRLDNVMPPSEHNGFWTLADYSLIESADSDSGNSWDAGSGSGDWDCGGLSCSGTGMFDD